MNFKNFFVLPLALTSLLAVGCADDAAETTASTSDEVSAEQVFCAIWDCHSEWQKLGEAEVMADAGIRDMLLTFNVVGGHKLKRLADLAGRTDISVVADNETVVEGLGRAGEAAGRDIAVLVECDTGFGRNGVQTPAAAVALAQFAASLPGVRFEGIMTFPVGTDGARAFLTEALALWRGPALCDFAFHRFAQADIARLEDQRLACVEERIDRELEEGRHAELTGELEALVAENPLRERLRCQLMVALYRSGRQAEALEAYQQARSTLVDELGIEPGRELRELHQAILNQDPALEISTEHVRPARQEEKREGADADGGSS